MRAGGSTVQQSLTTEAASIVKQAMGLARHRGHAQVTPLHVANIMLSSSTGLLRAACLQSHPHPLHCKALELCFSVALNRLPASSASVPMLGAHHPHGQHHHHPPSLSNALVAAFKRAQAQQRRGSIESQQQPLLAVKIEIEQLIISILDDPSVSRVMREAGFSSTQVKGNVEQVVSVEMCSTSAPSTTTTTTKPKENPSVGLPITAGSIISKPKIPPSDHVRQEDVTMVVDFLVVRQKRSVVIVGECLSTAEGAVKAVMDDVGKADVPEVLRNVQFISLPLMTFRCLSKEDVEQKVGELRCLVKSCCVERGAILYLGDLKWAAEYRATAAASGKGRGSYCPVEHVIMELGRLVSCRFGEDAAGGRVWLVGVATYQTYMKCKTGRPSLEAIWGLQPLTIPAGNLGLSLSCDSGICGVDGMSWSPIEKGGDNKLSCCRDCSSKFEIEARGLTNGTSNDSGSVTSSLPPWLQQYKEENKKATAGCGQDQLQLRDLCKKWNSICSSNHKQQPSVPDKFLSFSSVSPTSSSVSSYDQQCNLPQPRQAWPIPLNSKNTWRDHHNWISQIVEEGYKQPVSENVMQEGCKLFGSRFINHLNPNPNPSPISTSSSETMEVDYRHKFKELNAENLKALCVGLEKKVGWQRDIIPVIAGTVLRCRSGMIRRKDTLCPRVKEDTWLFFQGGDNDGKEKLARELACLVFGSHANFISIGLSSFSSTVSGSSDDLRNKRSRSEASHCYIERFVETLRSNPHSVILMEDVEQIDYYTQTGIKNAIERGRVAASNGEEVDLGDAIVILSCESFDSRSRACSPTVKQKRESGEENGVEREEAVGAQGHRVDLDLNLSAGDVDGDAEEWCFGTHVCFIDLVDGRFFFRMKEDMWRDV